MKKIVPLLLLLVATAGFAEEAAKPATPKPQPRVRIETSMGSFTVQLNPQRAPLTVESFLKYVQSGHYTNTIFHRVIENFVAQAGGYTPDYALKPTKGELVNESGNGLTNKRATIAMARTEAPHSATCQFYINLVDNPVLDPQSSRWGYAVFGEVIEGMEVIDRIGHIPTGKAGEFKEDVPLEQVVIKKAEIL